MGSRRVSGGLAEAIIIYLLALLLGVQMHGVAVLGVLVVVILSATLFSTLSLIIASLVKTRERFMGIGQVLTMPLFFASNAIYPLAIMPGWLQIIARINPLSYAVDLLRGYLVTGSTPGAALDWAVLISILAVLQIIAGKTYHHIML
jgi:ABC-2 type transport system permease protein